MMKVKHIFGLFAMMVLLVLSSCQKLDDLEPGSDALLPTRAVYSDDETDDSRPSLKGDSRAGDDIEDGDDDGNVNDDDDEEDDDEEQSLNGLPQ
ncbi:MAG: hypothetical protein ACJAU0_000967 [Flavobacteriales bacterium]|jgi:hypothetical protein